MMRVIVLLPMQTALLLITSILQAETPKEPPAIELGSTHTQVIHTKIVVSDLRRSYDFYTKGLGMKEVSWPGLPKPVFDDPNIPFSEVCANFSGSAADSFICLVKRKSVKPDSEGSKLTLIGIKVSDARATMERARAAALTVESEAKQVMGMTTGVLRDPDGYGVQVLEAKSVRQPGESRAAVDH